MNHLFFIGAVVGLIGLMLTLNVAFRATSSSEQRLSPAAERLLVDVSGERPLQVSTSSTGDMPLRIRDQFSLYSNSRFHLMEAHRQSLKDPSGEMLAWLEKAEETHSLLIRALILSAVETMMASFSRRVGCPHTRAAAGLYLDEDWILTEIIARRLELLEDGGEPKT